MGHMLSTLHTLWAFFLFMSIALRAYGHQEVGAACFLIACAFLGFIFGWKFKEARDLMEADKQSDERKTVA